MSTYINRCKNLRNFIPSKDVDADLKLKHPFIAIISGPTGSGKQRQKLVAVTYSELDKLKGNVQYREGLNEDFGDARGKP
jgi:pantothenate kinase-related protein Tda10